MQLKRQAIAGLAASAALISASAGFAQPLQAEMPDYVQTCDAFGRGYFYSPGTDTCLVIQGQIRAELGFGGDVGSGADADGYFSYLRPTLRIGSASDTELGALKTMSEHRFSYYNGNLQGYRLYRGYLELGGFKAGMDESAFKTVDDDYGEFINDGIIPAGGYRTILVSYTARPDPRFSFTLSAEEGGNDDANTNVIIESGVPYLAGGMKFTEGGFSTSLRAAYDSLNDAFAGKWRVTYNVNDRLRVWGQLGYKTNEDHYAVNSSGQTYRVVDSFYGTWGGDLAGWAGVAYKATDKTSVNVQLAYDGTQTFAATANIVHSITPNLLVMPEVSYTSWNDKRSWRDGLDQAQFRVRLQHRF